MSKRVMPKGRPFPKGVSGNPLGGKAHNKELKMIRKLTRAEVAEIGALVLQNNLTALRAIAKDPNASVLKVMISAVAVKTIEKGDAYALDKLLDRLIGKVKDEIEISGPEGGPIDSRISAMSPAERLSEIERLRAARLAAGDE